MRCQRARFLRHPDNPPTSWGKELWVLAAAPEPVVAFSGRNLWPDCRLSYATPYRYGHSSTIFFEPHVLELLARGPEDFADLPALCWEELLRENNITTRDK